MNIKLRLKKLEKQVNTDLGDKIIEKCGVPVYYIETTDSDEEKEALKQKCIEDFIIKISTELNMSVERAKQEFEKNDVGIISVNFV